MQFTDSCSRFGEHSFSFYIEIQRVRTLDLVKHFFSYYMPYLTFVYFAQFNLQGQLWKVRTIFKYAAQYCHNCMNFFLICKAIRGRIDNRKRYRYCWRECALSFPYPILSNGCEVCFSRALSGLFTLCNLYFFKFFQRG